MKNPQNLAFHAQTEASNPWLRRADSLTSKRAEDENSDVLKLNLSAET